MNKQITMFYDGSCPLCSREVHHYRCIDRNHNVNWIDISLDVEQLEAHQLSREDAMARLHVIDGNGQMQTGAAAFVALWSGLPYYRRLAGIVRGLGLIPLLDRVYEPFARWRLSRRPSSCSVTECR